VGEYEDPQRPGCSRTIEKNGPDYLITGTSSGVSGQKACSKAKAGKRWFMDGKVSSGPFGVSNTMSVDLPSKSGVASAKLKFNPEMGTQGGLVFPDGTEWHKSGPLVRESKPDWMHDAY